MKRNRSYSELIKLDTFEDRFDYLYLGGGVGEETFGCNRYLNQVFYRSKEWKRFRQNIIIRDLGCDLGVEDREIKNGIIIIHHLNPITIDDIIQKRIDILLNPENAICTSENTHKAIHYSDKELLILNPIERTRNDTCPWRH